MHRGLSHWPRTGVVYDTNADYVCPPYTGSRGDNLDNKPQAYGGHTCLWAVWLLGETVANADRLVVCRAAPGEKDSYIGHPLPFLWHEGSPRVTGYFPQYKKPRRDTNVKTRSRQRNRDHAQGSRRRLVSPSPTLRKQRKRGGKRRSGRGGQRREMRKADRLSKRYFRVCSWNCASANRRGAVLEKMVYDFDVVCLQETRTCPNRPLVLQGFTVIQRHEGRGMAVSARQYPY